MANVNSMPDRKKLSMLINKQRRRVLQASAIATCLGHALDAESTCAMSDVTDAISELLESAAAGLDPVSLGLSAKANI